MAIETLLYETLEVSVTASEAEIKKSYRRLALIHHPDKQPDGDHAQFQKIQNAYEVLSDPVKRAEYDRFGSDADSPGARRGPGGGGRGMEEELFEHMFGGGFGGMPGGGRRQPPPSQRRREPAQPSVVTLKVSLEDVFVGRDKKIEINRSRICGTCKGSGAKAKAKAKPCVKCKGDGFVYMMQVLGPFATRVRVECSMCDGQGEKVRPQDACKKCHGTKVVQEKNRVDFRVERGMLPREKIILRGEGDETADSSAPGDLHIVLDVLPHPTFKLCMPSYTGYTPDLPPDLQTTLSLTLSESLLGFSRLVLVHLDGRGLKVTQPAPGEKGWRILKTGDEVKIKGEGMWRKGVHGDLVCKIEVEMPSQGWAEALGPEKLAALEKLLPSKREDLHPVSEINEVDLEAMPTPSSPPPPRPSGGTHHQSPQYSTDGDSDDEMSGPTGCHHQ